MLDVARRIPFLRLLSGQYGIFPWFRPLSRELYFVLLAHAETYDLLLARILSVLGVAAAAWQVRGIAARIAGPHAGTAAALIFASHATTKFLVAWASGFQDVLAILLVLSAVRDQADGRVVRSMIWAFLSVFAKETAFLVFPILAIQSLFGGARRAAWRSWLMQLSVFVVAAGFHLGVRAGWHGVGRDAEVTRSWSGLAQAVLRAVAGFVGPAGAPEPGAAMRAAIVAGASALFLVFGGRAAPAAAAFRPQQVGIPRSGMLFVIAGAILGFLPLVLGHAMEVVTASNYYAFSAVPWLATLAGVALTRLPRLVGTTVVAALLGWNTIALGLQAPDLSVRDAWEFHDWDWAEAQRLSAVTDRLSGDLRAHLAGHPDSLVVLFFDLPHGCFFQSEDGPATRETLRDATVRSYWMNATPFGLVPGKFEILYFDYGTQHLAPYRPALRDRARLAASSVTAGEPAAAWAFANHGPPQENDGFDLHYYRTLAALMAEGVSGARRELALLGLSDTLGTAPERWATAAVGPEGLLHASMVRALRHPLDAHAHLELANACGAAHALVLEGVELRFAVTLDPTLFAERMRLARNLFENGKPEAALRDLRKLVVNARGTEVEAEARALLGRSPGVGMADRESPEPPR